MDIAIIGAGNVGAALARAVTKAGHAVTVTAGGDQAAQEVAQQTGARAVADVAEAAAGADVMVLAVPFAAVGDVAAALGTAADGRVVIDATNPLTEDMTGLTTTGRSGAEQVQDALPKARVVKAFNTVFAANQDTPELDGDALDGFYAGDDVKAKRTVAELLSAVGFRPVDAGPLAHAAALEHMAFLNIRLNATNDWPWRSGWRLVGPTG